MKMNNPELEVVRFGAEDILTASGDVPYVYKYTIYGSDHNVLHECDNQLVHVYTTGKDSLGNLKWDKYDADGEYSSTSTRGTAFSSFDGVTRETVGDAVNKWYYQNADKRYYYCGQ